MTRRSQKPKILHRKRLGNKMVKALDYRRYDAVYCATSEEARIVINSLIVDGSTVTWGGSKTIRDMGLPQMLKSRGTLEVLDRDDVTPAERQEIYMQAFRADFYLTSANAITEDGIIVNIDGNGNRVAAITWGPSHVIFVIGMNKVTKTIKEAVRRARTVAAPMNAARFNIDTPCHEDGKCHNCLELACICNYISFVRHSNIWGRIVVILVGEELGY